MIVATAAFIGLPFAGFIRHSDVAVAFMTASVEALFLEFILECWAFIG